MIPTRDIRGDVSVSRNVHIGGKADISGGTRVCGNLKVEGWLDAKNVKHPCKGLYRSVEALEEAYVTKHAGWWAGVLCTAEDLSALGVEAEAGLSYFRIYLSDGSQWNATDGLYKAEVSLDLIDERIDAVEDGLAGKVDWEDVANTTGQAEDKVMSQKAVTLGLSHKVDFSDVLNDYKFGIGEDNTGVGDPTRPPSQQAVGTLLKVLLEVNDKMVSKEDIAQSTGQAEDKVMSQKAVTLGLSHKVDFSDVLNDFRFGTGDDYTGTGDPTRPPSQQAVGTLLKVLLAVNDKIDTLEHPVESADTDDADLIIADEQENVIVTFKDGHIKTANFDSANIEAIAGTVHPITVADTDAADLIIADENENAIITVSGGHIKTANFDSANIGTSSGSGVWYYQPYNHEADLLYRDGMRRSKFAGCIPVVFVCGQSNADGRAPANTAPAWLSSAGYKVAGYKMWNASANEFADYCVTSNNGADGGLGSDGSGANKFSFDPFFAKAFIAQYGGQLLAIRQTMGAISIQGQPTSGTRNWTWQPKISSIVSGCNSMCLALMQKWQAAQEYARDNSLKLVPIAVLWHQGESDADGGYVERYRQNLMNVVSWIRGMVGDPTLPFISGYVQNGYKPIYAALNRVLASVANYDPYYKAVDMDGHYTSIDGLHFDAAGLEYMGTKMLEMYNSLNLY